MLSCSSCQGKFYAHVVLHGVRVPACKACYKRVSRGRSFLKTGYATEQERKEQGRFVLEHERHLTDDQIASKLGVSRHTVMRRRKEANAALEAERSRDREAQGSG